MFGEKYLWENLESQDVESQIFLMKRSAKYDFLEIYKIFNVTNSASLGY